MTNSPQSAAEGVLKVSTLASVATFLPSPSVLTNAGLLGSINPEQLQPFEADGEVPFLWRLLGQ
ncbi:hypothetical protein NUF40_001167 [Yersinia enterocolitica]|uniref:hypothetical protein n=1 Tax=Yersinia enterocolitica TaxID=630 RepID=UPI00387C09B1|nr:hypothetical protein [Yersinia enterocolitica]EKN4047439.1 hypothetical protein [Yersinia enterocolitica]EKN4758214.1 hypothetical protein [Yersinia enterocolitica]